MTFFFPLNPTTGVSTTLPSTIFSSEINYWLVVSTFTVVGFTTTAGSVGLTSTDGAGGGVTTIGSVGLTSIDGILTSLFPTTTTGVGAGAGIDGAGAGIDGAGEAET